MLKYSRKRDQFENSTGTNVIKGNNATSYGWWLYVTVVGGKRIMNNSYYSSSTCKHQGDARDHFNYNFDITIVDSTSSLDNPEGIKKDLLREITNLKTLINNPRTRKETNLRRIKRVVYIEDTLQQLHEIGFFNE